MINRRRILKGIGLVGCVAVAYGIHGLVGIGSCGGDGAPPCPDEATPYFIALFGGLIVALLFGGWLGIVGIVAAVVLGAVWAGFDAPPGERGGPFAVAGGFVAVLLLVMVIAVAAHRRHERAMHLVTTGKAAIGTVMTVKDTGVTINDDPRVTLTLRIEPEDGSPPFERVTTRLVPRVGIPRAGQRYPIWYDPADQQRFLLLTTLEEDAPPEARRLFALAQAPPAGDPSAVESGSGEPPPAADSLDRLAKLHALRLAGALTDAEFEAQKAKLLQAD